MPNWCSNTLFISGDESSVYSFINKGLVHGEWKLGRYYSMPDEFLESMSVSKWRADNWGVAIDVIDTYVSKYEHDHASIDFESAWTGPCEWLIKVGAEYPHLNFRLVYVEKMNNISGICEIRGGQCMLNEQGDSKFISLFN